MFGLKLFIVLFITFLLTLTGTLVFLRGFLLSRTVIEKNSECEANFAFKTDDHKGHGVEGCWIHGRFKRAIIIIVDALRYDFMSYNVSLRAKEEISPYQNNLKIVYELERSKPLNTLQFKFMADPPTTTLQRLKGLTTGSLPTFVDAGANFQSSEITEDNIIDQMVKQGKKIKFFGDDTWMSLFPNRFFKHFEFPSFDVKDLHTVDNGILANLYQEIKKSDWDVTIAHFLGVDHCGHLYGPNHEAMRAKLVQMDKVIRNVTQLMKDDTILFVMGDHGMTRTGDHGGDSSDELTAGLFIYSPAQLIAQSQRKITTVSQTDFVPTVSLLLGLPIPFSNLGMVIPELFSHCPWWHTDTNEVRRVYHRVKALRLNTLQIHKYLQKYQETASDLPVHTLKDLGALISQAEEDLRNLVPDLMSGEHPDSILKQFLNIENTYKQYSQTAKDICQGVWAKFDMSLVVTGVVVILSGMFLAFVLCVSWKEDEAKLPLPSLLLISGALLLMLYVIVHVQFLSESVPPLMAFILALVIIFASCICLKNSVIFFPGLISIDNVVSAVLMLMYCGTFFSNSFVVHEDYISFYLLQTLVAYYSIKVAHFYIKSRKGSPLTHRSESFKHSRKTKAKFDVMQIVSSPLTVIAMVAVCLGIILRSSHIFLACREEQHDCEDSIFTSSLSSIDKSYVNQRYVFSLLCMAVMVYAVRRWLRYYGNLIGSDAGVVAMCYAPPVAAVCMGLFWALHAVPRSAVEAMSPWQQAVLAQVVYVVVVLALTVLLKWPLLVYHHDTSVHPSSAILNSTDLASVIPKLYNQLKVRLSSGNENQKPPVVYGLGSIYCASLVALVSLVGLLLALLLGDGVAPSLTLALLAFYFCMELYSAVAATYDADKESSDEQILQDPAADANKNTSPIWSGIVMLNLLSSVFFYATGHQATIPSIRFESAYTGLYGNFSSIILPGLLIWLNTFAGPVFFTLASPLLVTWPSLEGSLMRWMTQPGEGQSDRWQGDFRLFNNGVRLRRNMFRVCCGLIAISSLRLFAAVCAAALHRGHLMVWKIFAPRLVFEAALFITTSVCSLLAFLFVLRVDKALSRFVDSLPSDKQNKAV